MKTRNEQSGDRRASVNSLQIFISVFLVAMAITIRMEHIGISRERDRMAHVAQSICSETYEIMLSEMSKTRVLEAYLMQTGGEYRDFGHISQVLLREDFVRNVLFAPGGIVSAVYPLEGNESVIGLNMYQEGAGNKEAQAAIKKGELYVAGPFELIQGGMGIAGRLPVYLDGESGGKEFWGIVSVTLDFPEVLSSSSISRVEEQGFACQVWRINPDTDSRQVIMSTAAPVADGKTIDLQLPLFNSVWTVSISSLTPWYARESLWLGIAVSGLLSVLAAVGAHNREKLRAMQAEETRREIDRLQEQLEREHGNMLLGQIRSHFFYHTLNALQALIVLKPDAAYKMAGDFSRYLRFSLDASANAGGIGSFREELRAARAYADINQAQLGDRLNMVYDVPDADFNMPSLTIQPILENAILHGIKPKVGGGTVTVRLEELENSWLVTVEDDGMGFDPAEATDAAHIGLNNVKKRMGQFPGCSVNVESVKGQGSRVRLTYSKGL